MNGSDTIYALSSGKAPSGVAVIRVSGPQSRFVVETMCGNLPVERRAELRKIRHPRSSEVIDEGLCLWFPGPASFTGEDSAEFQVHGGPAVVLSMLEALGSFEKTRLADAGEFSRRAFENGRLDLTEIEGLADLVAAETELQRRQAIAQAGGALRERLEGWRERIVRMRALVEAGFDFADEEDVPDDPEANVWGEAGALASEIRLVLDDDRRGEIIRDGFQVVLMGAPNAGKSSLLNALVKREAAIVTDEAGTTRDLIEVHLDLDGYPVTLVDTAGLRETEGKIEREGIRRARERASVADLIIWLWPADETERPQELDGLDGNVLVVRSKDDSGYFGSSGISIEREDGMSDLIEVIKAKVAGADKQIDSVFITRARHRELLERCVDALDGACDAGELAVELRSELLRQAGDHLGRITGRIETEHLLDVIFSEFCIGK